MSDDLTKEEKQRSKTFNNLTAKEWTKLSRNVWRNLSSARKDYHKEHGATFSVKLAERLIKIYSGPGDYILDPFVGTGTTSVAARNLGRNSIGIELNEKFYKIAKKRKNQKKLSDYEEEKNISMELINDDCLNLHKIHNKKNIQATITSPPYANLIHKAKEDRKNRKDSWIESKNNSTVSPYSQSSKDFGNMEYERYLKHCRELMEKLYDITTEGGYNIWIVKDFRDTENDIPYVPLHQDISEIGQNAGFKYHDLIVIDQNQHRSLVVLGYPSVFYTNQNSSFVVVFRK